MRQPGCHWPLLRGGRSQTFLAGAWSAEHVSGGIAAGKPFGFDEPGERYAGNMIVSNEPLAPAAHGAIADDQQTNIVAHLTKPGERLQEVQNTLAPVQAPDVEQRRRHLAP